VKGRARSGRPAIVRVGYAPWLMIGEHEQYEMKTQDLDDWIIESSKVSKQRF